MLAFIVGYVQQSFRLTFYIFAAGVVLSLLLCMPDYPFYNTHPLPWQQPVKPAESHIDATGAEGEAAVTEAVGGGEEHGLVEEDEAVLVKKKKSSKKPAAAGVRK